MSNPEQTTIEFYNEHASEWAGKHNFSRERNAFSDALNLFYEAVPDGSSVIEVGCGGGRDAMQLVDRYNYFGIDASEGLVNFARELVPDGEFEVLNLYELETLGKKFDAFWSAAVLLHVPKAKIDEALQSIRSVLNENAFGVISIKDGDDEIVHDGRFFSYWTKEDFENTLDKNNFSTHDYSYVPVSEKTRWHIFMVASQPS